MKTITSLLALTLFASGCGDTPPALATLSYELSCSAGFECVSGFTGIRSINQYNGAAGVDVSCDAQTVGGNIDLALSALDGAESDRFGISITNLRVNPTTFALEASACRVIVRDGDVPFGNGPANGACGAEAPSASQPCQIANVSIDGNTVELMMACTAIASATIGNERRDVTGVGASEMASLRFENCSGL